GSCGSCWAFSTTGSLEGQHKKKTGQLVSLSEQNLIDCCTANNGCHGGLMDDAFEFIKSESGIDTEESYPYEEAITLSRPPGWAPPTGHVDIPSETRCLETGSSKCWPPVGVYDEPECRNEFSDLTHAVLVVGYGTEEGKDFWLVKNSWGQSFGVNGYIKMSRNKNNQCGIATVASYPLV
ncbi:cathepsin L, partial [Nephila pilipes]